MMMKTTMTKLMLEMRYNKQQGHTVESDESDNVDLYQGDANSGVISDVDTNPIAITTNDSVQTSTSVSFTESLEVGRTFHEDEVRQSLTESETVANVTFVEFEHGVEDADDFDSQVAMELQPFSNVYEFRPNRSSWRNLKEGYVATTLTTLFTVKQGTRQLGVDAIVSMMSELRQLHRKGIFRPVKPKSFRFLKRRKILRTIMFLKKKRDGRIKSRLVADGSRQSRKECVIDDVSSPIVNTESIFIQAVIIANENRLVEVVDVEGGYLHADMPGEVIAELD
jgi:hypothetical protein